MSGGVGGTRTSRRANLLAGASLATLVLVCGPPSLAQARDYTASNEAELRQAITDANADGDASATIRITQNFSLSTTALPAFAKPMTIDTQGNTLSQLYFGGTDPNTLTITGNISGTGGPAFTTVNATGHSTVINNGTITGRASTGAVAQNASFINNGTLIGGNTGVIYGGGALVQSGGDLTNNGLIKGGSGAAHAGGSGVYLGNSVGVSTLTNNTGGVIQGGDGQVGTSTGYGVFMRNGSGLFTNAGTVIGGSNSAAINTQVANSTIINSGTLTAGAGQVNAITTTSNLVLELRAGSVINGNVVGSTTLSDTLRLGGTGSSTFDVSKIDAAGQYQNFDVFEKTGTSTWLLTGNATVATDWTIDDGTLLIGDHTTPTSVIGNITNAGTLGGSGTIIGDVTSSGTVAPGNSIGTLTINGNYTGNGGTLAIETVLGGDASATDKLVVTGDTAGTTNVRVTNLGGTGARTVEGIKIVDVGGTSAGNFSLDGNYVYQGEQAVTAGAYAYRLYKNGVSTPADGDWYLRSALTLDPALPATAPLYQPGVPLYEAYPQILLGLNGLSTLQQRVGDRYWPRDGVATSIKGPDNAWLRTEGTHASFEPDLSTSATSYDYDLFKLEAGLDGELYQDQSGRLIGGLTVHYGTISGDINSVYGNGDIDTTGYGAGATLTWYGDNGVYLDAQGQATWYDSDLKSDLLDSTMESGNNGFGYALSLEGGRRFVSSGPWSITPQAQLIYSSIDFDTFSDQFGARISLDDGASLLGRLGVALDREEKIEQADGQTALAKLYGIANLYGEFLDGTAVDVSGTGFESKNDPVWAGLTFGGSYSWNDDRVSLYGEVAAKSSLKNFADSYAISGTAGLRVKW